MDWLCVCLQPVVRECNNVSSTLNLNELLNYELYHLFSDNDLIINQFKKNHKRYYWFIPVDGPQDRLKNNFRQQLKQLSRGANYCVCLKAQVRIRALTGEVNFSSILRVIKPQMLRISHLIKMS
jgi:hypothetical protein